MGLLVIELIDVDSLALEFDIDDGSTLKRHPPKKINLLVLTQIRLMTLTHLLLLTYMFTDDVIHR